MYLKGMISLWGKTSIYTQKLYTFSQNDRHLLYTWPFYIWPTQKTKNLLVLMAYFFIIGWHTFTILFYIWLIFSRHKTINTKNKILYFIHRYLSLPFFYLVWIFFDVSCFISFVIIPNQLLVLRYLLRYTWSIYDLGICCW